MSCSRSRHTPMHHVHTYAHLSAVCEQQLCQAHHVIFTCSKSCAYIPFNVSAHAHLLAVFEQQLRQADALLSSAGFELLQQCVPCSPA
eukprot:1156174-Pelagomonas_calceolata.AAC.6